ncbi:MAG: ribonuclease H family protein [Acetatifactor sp.]|nr:ribonuclease H family protein [Acetatifactor sp.]
MAAKKVYAVRKGKVIGILDSWDACREAVDGYPGAEYKSFKTMEEARSYMKGVTYTVEPAAQEGSQTERVNGKAAKGKRNVLSDREKRPRGVGDPEGGLVAYVDGSYEHSVKKYAFGCVFILPDDTVYVENGSGSNPDTAQLRNVSGEMLGAMYAVRWAIRNGFSRIELRYDYEGIEKWVTGAWKSKTELTRKYAEAMRRWMGNIQMRFTKVAAHTNVYYNELADRLAKDGLTEREEIPDVWRMEEMEPWAE